MNCKYKVKIKRIQYNYRVQMAQLQGKYKFNIFCTGGNKELEEKVNTLYEAWPRVSGTGETITLDNTIAGKMLVDLKGNTSQEGTPTPESPQDIHVVSGDNSIEVCGKNIFNLANYTIQGWDCYIENPMKTEGSYVVSCVNDYPVANKGVALGFTNTIGSLDNGYFCGYVLGASSKSVVHITTQVQANSKYLMIRSSEKTNIDRLNSMKIMLEKGNQATTYEEYKSASYPISLGDKELCKIGDYQDSIVKDSGKWYLNKQIGKVVLNGSENWTQSGQATNTYRFALSQTLLQSNIEGYCNTNNFVTSGVSADTQLIGISGGTIYYRISKSLLTALDVTQFKNWLASNNSIVYAPLITPTYETITDTTLLSQLETVKRSYSGQTNISQTNDDKPFILTAKALKDLSNL